MARKPRPAIEVKDLEGLKYFKALRPVLEPLHDEATARDRAGNRKLHFDQYTALLLLHFFNPILTSLRGIQQASELATVQERLGCSRASLGSLSEAAGVFDADRLTAIIDQLSAQVPAGASVRENRALANLTAVDGSLLPALPRMAWALWLDDTHRAAKMHVAFEVRRGVPRAARVTPGNTSERATFRDMLEPGRLYVMDRGYAAYGLFQQVIDAGSDLICRVRANAVWETLEERPIGKEAWAAGVRRDEVVWLGGAGKDRELNQPMRIVEVHVRKEDGSTEIILLATNRLDLDAEVIALAYRYRWSVELFFRWFKCILGCRHLISQDRNGVTIQIYVAIIASLLVSLWTGRKPTKRTFEMICLFFSGWASHEELQAHIARLTPHSH